MIMTNKAKAEYAASLRFMSDGELALAVSMRPGQQRKSLIWHEITRREQLPGEMKRGGNGLSEYRNDG